MKKLVVMIVLLAAAVACTRSKPAAKHNAARFQPKLTFGQEVTVASGFYKGTLVKVRSTEECKEDNNGTYASDLVCYTVTLTGPTGEQMYLSNFAEREILGE